LQSALNNAGCDFSAANNISDVKKYHSTIHYC